MRSLTTAGLSPFRLSFPVTDLVATRDFDVGELFCLETHGTNWLSDCGIVKPT